MIIGILQRYILALWDNIFQSGRTSLPLIHVQSLPYILENKSRPHIRLGIRVQILFAHFDFFAGMVSAKAGICLIRILLRAALVNYLVNWVISLDHGTQHWVRLEAAARGEVPRRAADDTTSMYDRCTALIIQARSINSLSGMR